MKLKHWGPLRKLLNNHFLFVCFELNKWLWELELNRGKEENYKEKCIFRIHRPREHENAMLYRKKEGEIH